MPLEKPFSQINKSGKAFLKNNGLMQTFLDNTIDACMNVVLQLLHFVVQREHRK